MTTHPGERLFFVGFYNKLSAENMAKVISHVGMGNLKIFLEVLRDIFFQSGRPLPGGRK